MYTSLPWEGDITRVYEFQRSSEGISFCVRFHRKKGDIWCSVEAQGGRFVYIPTPSPTVRMYGFMYALWSRKLREENEMRRERQGDEGHAANAKH